MRSPLQAYLDLDDGPIQPRRKPHIAKPHLVAASRIRHDQPDAPSPVASVAGRLPELPEANDETFTSEETGPAQPPQAPPSFAFDDQQIIPSAE